jgi:4-hydroxybenzoyl-CoA thioesterase
MPRVQIALPERFPFTTRIEIRINEINYGGHLGNDAALSLAHEARMRFFRHLDLHELDVGGYGILVADAAIQYKSEGFHGDALDVAVGATDFGRKGCDLVYRMTHSQDGREVVVAKTGIVFFDYGRRRVVRIPEVFLERLESA